MDWQKNGVQNVQCSYLSGMLFAVVYLSVVTNGVTQRVELSVAFVLYLVVNTTRLCFADESMVPGKRYSAKIQLIVGGTTRALLKNGVVETRQSCHTQGVVFDTNVRRLNVGVCFFRQSGLRRNVEQTPARGLTIKSS